MKTKLLMSLVALGSSFSDGGTINVAFGSVVWWSAGSTLDSPLKLSGCVDRRIKDATKTD